MAGSLLDPAARTLDEAVAQFEAAWTSSHSPNLADFLPDRAAPLFLPILRELVRVDLEFGWEHGRPKTLEDYLQRFPELRGDRASLAAITFEEFRLRQQAGQRPEIADYVRRYGVEPAPRSTTPSDLPPTRCLLPDALLQAAESPLTRRGLGDEPSSAEALDALRLHEPDLARDLSDGLMKMPAAGDNFAGFRLLQELGQGAFARVFLAEQPVLADRKVVLKIASDGAQESQTLAQLQHTHIVPIYSMHRVGSLHAVCMPYFGATTLADVLHDICSRPTLPNTGQDLLSTLKERSRRHPPSSNSSVAPSSAAEPAQAAATPPPAPLPALVQELEGRSYVDAVLWLGRCLADGLAHAHERGVVHRDLKPANVLITDDGQPMLLDFNLSENTRLRSSPTGAMLGGTLPYMAPEHLDAFRGGPRQVDARSDLYSVGLLLYELLTGRSPYLIGRRGHLTGVRPDLIIEQMIAERKKGPPALRAYNPAITPSVEAIVARCLEPDPAKRYQTARQLQEDLQRQIDARPLAHVREPSRRERLRKWLHRHPRFLAKSAGACAVVLLAAAVASGLLAMRHARGEQALLALDGFRTDSQTVRAILNAQADDPEQRGRALQLGRAALDRYGVLSDAGWDDRPPVTALPGDERSRLLQEVGDLLLLMARTQAWPVARSRENPKTMPQEPLNEALALNEQAERCFNPEQAPAALWLQRADLYRQMGDADGAQRLRGKAAEVGPQTAHDYFLMAREHYSAGRTAAALPLLRRAVELDPRQYWAWFYLGNCNDEVGDDVRSVVCYSVCLALDARAYEAYFNRGLAYLRQQDYSAALADFDLGVAQRPELPEPYLNRALARQGLGQFNSAIEDLTAALEKPNAPTRIYFMRARVRARAGDRAGADHDRAEGLRATPADEKSWIARGLARLADDPRGALADFEQALALNPRSRSALQNKAHVLAEKLNRPIDAIAALDHAVALYPDYLPARVGRGVLHARRGQRDQALADAKQALQRQPSGLVRYQAACIYALTSQSHPADRQEALKLLIEALRQGFGIDLLGQDTDLDPLRQLPEFQRLAAAAEAWQAAIRLTP